MKKTLRVFVHALSTAALGVFVGANAARADFIVTPILGPTTNGYTDYVLTILNNGLHSTGSTIQGFDLTVSTPGSGTAGALLIDLNNDTNGDDAIDANVGGLSDLSFGAASPTFGTTIGTFLGVGAGPLNSPLSSSQPGVLSTPTAVHVNGHVATYLSKNGSSSGLDAAFAAHTVHSLEVAVNLGSNAVPNNSSAIPFANIVVPVGTQFSFSGTVTGSGGGTFTVGSGQSTATGPVISLTGSSPANSNNIGAITLQGLQGHYAAQSMMVSGNAQTKGFLTVNGFNPTNDKEVYALSLHDNGQFLPLNSPVLSTIISDLNTALGSAGTATTVTPAFQSIFSPNIYDVMVTFAGGPTPTTSAPSVFAYDLSGYTTNGNVTVAEIAVIPEPASLGVFVLGGMALLGRRRHATPH